MVTLLFAAEFDLSLPHYSTADQHQILENNLDTASPMIGPELLLNYMYGVFAAYYADV